MGGQLTLSGNLTGVPLGNINVGPFSIVANGSNNLEALLQILASGANTITVPSWAVGCLIIPNSGNATALTLKGVTGDTGVPLSETTPTLLNFTTPPASFVLTAGALFTTETQIVFF